ncbi:MAG TPA: DUF1801 domain-containing protein [Caulobacteraceae bacterium]|jgi:hypothetical protein
MDELFRFPAALRRDPAVEAWFAAGDPLRAMVQPWWEVLRACGPDIRELIHDHRPTACAGEASFAYVDAFAAHANIGFWFGAELPDPAGLLGGTGKRMRHVRLAWGAQPDAPALKDLIAAAHADIRRRLLSPPAGPR